MIRRRSRARRRGMHQQGLTLLGVLIAVGLVVLVIAALALLAQRIGDLTRLTLDRHTATFLAREGLELTRSLRDDNWLAALRCTEDEQFVKDRCAILWRGNPDGTIEEQRRALCDGTWMIDPFTGGTGPELVGVVDNGQLFLTPAGFFTHARIGNEGTPFRRTVEITTANAGGNCGEVYTAADSAPPAEFLVRSRVQWFERAARGERVGPSGLHLIGQAPSRLREVVLSEQVYPWLKVR